MGIAMSRARTALLTAWAVMPVLATACVSPSDVEPDPGLAHPRRPESDRRGAPAPDAPKSPAARGELP